MKKNNKFSSILIVLAVVIIVFIFDSFLGNNVLYHLFFENEISEDQKMYILIAFIVTIGCSLIYAMLNSKEQE